MTYTSLRRLPHCLYDNYHNFNRVQPPLYSLVLYTTILSLPDLKLSRQLKT